MAGRSGAQGVGAALARDTLFVGLTRPQMLGGVTYSFFIINLVLSTEAFPVSYTHLDVYKRQMGERAV